MIKVSGAELRPGDKIMHPNGRFDEHDLAWRHLYTVKKQPSVSPGSWSLSCEVVAAGDGARGRISIGPTEVVYIERKGA